MSRLLVPGLGRRIGVIVAVVAIVTQLGLISVVAWGSNNVAMIRDWLVVGKIAGSSELDAYVAESGLSAAGRFYLLAAKPILHSPDTFDVACPVREAGIAALGCYSAETDTIHLLDIGDDTLKTLKPVVAAHEALHAIWARLDSTERSAIAIEVEKSFASVRDPGMLSRLAPYEELMPAERDGELFAILGTESVAITPALDEVYSRYFDDRMACVRLAASSANVIAEITSGIESIGAQILAVEELVVAASTSYSTERKSLRRDIKIFNARADTRGYFASSSIFERERSALTNRKKKLERSRIALNALIEQFNALVAQLTVLNSHAMNLNSALGIDASAMVTIPAEP
ncbi:MAG: hypothetical protein NWS64_01655 [Microbacteriaceae bacterium]|nr:hypothetical protein [Microbacteriaceae bacterium]